jgi:hypothetical protein
MGKIESKLEELVADGMLQLTQRTTELAAGMQQFHASNRLTGARAIAAGDRTLAWTGSCRLVGWSVMATGGPVTLLIRDSRYPGDGDVLAVVDLADGDTESRWMGPGGVTVGEALTLERAGAGRLVGSVYLGAVD